MILFALPLFMLGCGGEGNTVIQPADDAEADEQMRAMQAQFEGSGGGGKEVGN
jgi:hypothetical protein